MKTTILLFVISTVMAMAAPPENICVTMVPDDFNRAATAFGSILGLGRPATNEEITQATAMWLGNQTHDYERRQNMQSYTPPPFDPGSGKGYMNGPPAGSPTPSAAKAAPTPTPKKKK